MASRVLVSRRSSTAPQNTRGQGKWPAQSEVPIGAARSSPCHEHGLGLHSKETALQRDGTASGHSSGLGAACGRAGRACGQPGMGLLSGHRGWDVGVRRVLALLHPHMRLQKRWQDRLCPSWASREEGFRNDGSC